MIAPSRSVARQGRHHVLLHNPVQVPDGEGGFATTWSALTPPDAFASIEPATAAVLERVTSGTVVSTASDVITFPYRADVTTKTRILAEESGVVYSVVGVMSPGGLNGQTVCACVALVA